MEATNTTISLATSRHGHPVALLERLAGRGHWELHLFVDDPDDLHIIDIAPGSWARLDALREYLQGATIDPASWAR